MKIRFFKAANGQWYWSLVASNGRIIADGAEGYESRSNVQRAWLGVAQSIREWLRVK